MTPDSYGTHPFAGSLPYLDLNKYLSNVKIEAFNPHRPTAGHTWQGTFDWKGRRYLYDYYRASYAVFDITDPHNITTIGQKTLAPTTVTSARSP